MNLPLNGFRMVVAIGVLMNAAFWVPALVWPQTINDTFGLDPNYYTVWLRNVGMVLLLVSITNAAAAFDPIRYRLFAWLVVAGRLIAASFFLEIWIFDGLGSSDRPDSFMWLFITDASLGSIKGILLYAGLKRYDDGNRQGTADVRLNWDSRKQTGKSSLNRNPEERS